MSGMQERAARAAFNAFYGPGAFIWGHIPDEERDEWRVVASAVLAVVADVEGIAGVLAGHQMGATAIDGLPWCWGCHKVVSANHQAEQVAAYILGQS